MGRFFFLKIGFIKIAFTVLLCCQIYAGLMMLLDKTSAGINPEPLSNTNQLLSNSNKDSLLVTYPTLPSAKSSSTYSLTVNEQTVFVEKYNSISYAHFAFAGKADIKITVTEDVNKYTLSPKSYKIPSISNGNKISFSLTNPSKLILQQVNSLDEKLFILADPLEDKAPKIGDANVVNIMNYGVDNTGSNDVTQKIQQAINDVANQQGILYFPAGQYKTRQLNLQSNMTLYLEGGSELKATQEINPSYGHGVLNLENVSNVKIMGRGVINANGSYWRSRGGWYSLIEMSNVNNVLLEDIILRDSCVANVWIEYSENVNVYNAKILNDLDSNFVNTDGFDFFSSRKINVDNVLYKGTDDATSHGGNKKGNIQNNEDINIKNSVFYAGGGFKIGTTTQQDYIRNINYENIDIVYTEQLAGLFAVTGANFENIYFKNIRLEDILDHPTESGSASLFEFRIMVADWEENSNPNDLGYIKNIYFQNLNVDNLGGKNSIFQGYDSQQNISNVNFDNFYLKDKLMTNSEEALFKIIPSEKEAENYVELNFSASNPTIVNINTRKMYASSSGDAGEFVVSRTGDISQDLIVKYTIRGTAENGVDYQSINNSVTIPGGKTEVVIPILPQKAPKGLETVFLSLENLPNSTKYMLGANFHAVINIL